MLAIQGPEALPTVNALSDGDLSEMKYYRCGSAMIVGEPCFVATTGYTGEPGFELVFDARSAERMWDLLLLHGKDRAASAPAGWARATRSGSRPACRSTGTSSSSTSTRYEAGLDFAVSSTRTFRRGAALKKVKAPGPARKLLGFVVDGKRIPRQGRPSSPATRPVGKVTSGTSSPTLDKVICMAFVPRSSPRIRATPSRSRSRASAPARPDGGSVLLADPQEVVSRRISVVSG